MRLAVMVDWGRSGQTRRMGRLYKESDQEKSGGEAKN